MKHCTTHHTCKLRESHTLYTASAWKSWTPCYAWQQFMRSVCYCATTGRRDLFAWCTFTHAPLILICLCATLHPHHRNLFSRFITPPHNLLPLLPRLLSSQYVRPMGLRQQPSAVRYSRLSSPPGKKKKEEEEGGIHQNCADSALSVRPFFIIHRTTLLSCQERRLNA